VPLQLEERLPVLRPRGGYYYSATVSAIRQLIRAGLARPFSRDKRRLDGCILNDGPERPHAGTKYVFSHAVSEKWTDRDGTEHRRNEFDANVRGVYAFKRISHLDRACFRQVQTSCLSSR